MNKTNIIALAAFIEKLPEEKFDMCNVVLNGGYLNDRSSCGSPSCIAGWAAWEEQGRPEIIHDNGETWSGGGNSIINSALAYFGINDKEEGNRVQSELFRGDYGDTENDALTKADAVRALRTYAETQEIVWPGDDEEDDD